MKYVFQFSFSFDDGSNRECAFMMDEKALGKLGISSPDSHELPESHIEWIEETVGDIEEAFGIIHDNKGVYDDETLIEGFSTFEASPKQSLAIMDAWHKAFEKRLHGEGTLSPVVSLDGTEENPPVWADVSLLPTEVAEMIETDVANIQASPTARNSKPTRR